MNLHDGIILLTSVMHVRYSDRTSYFCAWRFYSAILLFFYLPPARLSLVCLVILSCWMYYIRKLHIICFSFFLLFLPHFIYLPLATRCVIAQGEHTAVSHLAGLNFLLAHIISPGSYHFALFRVFALAFLFGLQPRRL